MKINRNFCKKCVLSDAIPNIVFDEHGVCNYCNDKSINPLTQSLIESSKKRINELFKAQKGTSEYDAIMCYSGGKDSSYTLLLAKEVYGLNVLSFTLDNGYISPTAFKNIERVVTHLNIDQITVRPSAGFMNRLIKVSGQKEIYNPKSVLRISSICNSCISMVNMIALRFALEKKVPFILAGFTLGQIPSQTIIYKNNYKFLKESRKPVIKRLKEHLGDSVERYLQLPDHLIDNVDNYPHNINLLCLEDITEEEIVKRVEAIGWRSPGDVDGCSSNCRLNTFNNYIHQKRYGYNPYEWELSHMIRNGLINRSQALEKLADQPEAQLKEIMHTLKFEEPE